ncbi:hypothetical protein AB1Y20_000667 [Prymnesium parvum]|uniref:YEATS domain-containing protein n=1 Tax=Prymnesium parvum TaxID=97485 RepID=A0AB34K601_PRYPA|mmetsp:Transcript_14547/g.34640  ORF Transcript_14547/g.34640 Transcript_14547/m.34640 type:complete len:216 (+) Transcript_14547:14-661(+)
MAHDAPSSLSKPFVVGSCAHWLGKRAEEGKSHEWTVYVRLINPDEDPSLFIKRVVFHLHPTLQPPTRVVETAPFMVAEQGWGEFEIHLQIYFHDSNDKPLELSHMLKLYPEADSVQPGAAAANRPVVSERYDEFVFNDPSEGLRARLTAEVVPSNKGWRNSPDAKWFHNFDAELRHEELQQVYQVITAELQNASKRRLQAEEELRTLRAGELGSV